MARCWILCLSIALTLGASPCEFLRAQTPDLPRLEYFVARDLYDTGNLSEATEGFRVALNRGQQVKGQRWIDAIPPLVMLGECYYQQGAIAQSLEQYDAALMVALAFPKWAEAMRFPDNLPELPAEAKGLTWTRPSRPVNVVRVPNVMQVALDAAAARFNGDGNLVPGGTQILRVDVPEVLRCLGVALTRRAQLLGPLAPHSPLSRPIADWLAVVPTRKAPWLHTAWHGLHGMALLSLGDVAKAEEKLNLGVSIEGKSDYFLSASCLLALATLEYQQGKEPAAFNRLGDASLRAAQLEQADILADALAMIGQCACASGRADLLPTLQAATAWSKSYSVLPFLHGSAALSELAVVAGNLTIHEAAATEMLAVMRGKGAAQDRVALPRVQAQLGYAMARAAAAQNLLPLADSQLEKSISLLRGNQATGAAVPRVFQTQLTLELISRKNLSAADGERILSRLLDEPSIDQWKRQPLECLACLATPHLSACDKALELALARNDHAAVIERMADQQLELFHELLPMGGRMLAARYWMNADKASWPAEMAGSLDPVLKAIPAIRTLPISLGEAIGSLAKEPLVIEDKQMSAEVKKKLLEIGGLAEQTENAMMNLALQRLPLERNIPGTVQCSRLIESLDADDVVLSFVHSPTQVFGAAVSRTKQHTWTVPDSPALDAKIALLLTQLGLNTAPNLDLGPKVPWRNTAAELSKLLVPDSARQMIASAKRIVIVPSGNLWYLPFDMLPLDNSSNALLAKHRVTYVPTLAHLSSIYAAAPAIRSTAGIFNTFFLADRVSNQTLCNRIGQELNSSVRMDLHHKAALSTPGWLRLKADQIWVASELPMASTAWELRVLPLEPSRDNALANWLQSPMRAPARMFLPGLQSHATKVEMKGGHELFVPAAAMMTCGVKSLWMSRWKVGGRSAHQALSRLLDEIEYESPSAAWQRAAVSLWADKLPTSDESILPSAKGLPATIDGSHPLLWSGYMMIGDHKSPQ